MPLDLGPFIADSKYTSTTQSYPSGNAYVRTENPAGAQELLVQLLQTKFPDYLAAASSKLLPVDSPVGARADFTGTQIRAGKLTGPTTTTNQIAGKQGGVNYPYQGPNTDQLIENLTTVLHEIFHDRAKSLGSFGRRLPKTTEGKLTPDTQQMLNTAHAGGFPSISGHFALGDSAEEFLATAVALTDMQERGIQPTGRFKEVAKTFDQIKQQYPWVESFVNEYRFPEMIPPKK